MPIVSNPVYTEMGSNSDASGPTSDISSNLSDASAALSDFSGGAYYIEKGGNTEEDISVHLALLVLGSKERGVPHVYQNTLIDVIDQHRRLSNGRAM